eukprot:2251465-Rhodomonas_salina.1
MLGFRCGAKRGRATRWDGRTRWGGCVMGHGMRQCLPLRRAGSSNKIKNKIKNKKKKNTKSTCALERQQRRQDTTRALRPEPLEGERVAEEDGRADGAAREGGQRVRRGVVVEDQALGAASEREEARHHEGSVHEEGAEERDAHEAVEALR